MKLCTTCTSCKKDIRIRSMSLTRPDLEMEKGEHFQINCLKCGTRYPITVDEVHAKINKNMVALGVGLGFLVTVFLWDFIGVLSTVSVIIPILILKQESNSAYDFNSYRIGKRK